jgi:hypothetical protein
MSLYTLKREYEDRRQALIDQLQKNPSLDPATQHQIYGAIKEIENFLKTMEYQIASEQEKHMNVELSTERPQPFFERTQKAIYHVAHGTKKIFTHHIPGATKSVLTGPKRYFDRKKEETRMRKEVEAEVLARKHNQQLEQTTEHVVLEHPHQELAVEAPQEPPLPTWQDETVIRSESAPEPKRAKPITKPARSKTRPSKKAKKGHQHKPHLKRDKYRR